MNTTFSLQRIGLLLQRFFIERGRSEIIYWSIVTLVFMFFRNIVESISFFIYIGGAIYTVGILREIHSPTNGTHYFMIPATRVEKFSTSIIISLFYYFAMALIAYIVGNLLGTFFNNLLASFSTFFEAKPLQWVLFKPTGSLSALNEFNITVSHSYAWSYFFNYAGIHAVFLLGGIYFKRNAAGKTMLSMFIIFFTLVIITIFMAKTFFERSGIEPAINFQLFITNVYNIISSSIWIINVLFILALWSISYVRLTEKEV